MIFVVIIVVTLIMIFVMIFVVIVLMNIVEPIFMVIVVVHVHVIGMLVLGHVGGQEILELEILFPVSGHHIGNVQEAIAALPKVDESCANRGFQIDHPATINIVDQSLLAV